MGRRNRRRDFQPKGLAMATTSTDLVASTMDDQVCITHTAGMSDVPVAGTTKLRRLAERGMATVEYAIGILAAAALALVLLRIITGADFFSVLLKFVVGLIAKIPLP